MDMNNTEATTDQVLYREQASDTITLVVFEDVRGFVVANETTDGLWTRYAEPTLDRAIAAAQRTARGIRFDAEWMAR
jgi:hypothetical protein